MKPHYHSAKAVFITILTCAALLTSCSDNDSETAPENSSTSPEYHYSHVPLKNRQNIKKVFPNKRLVSTEVLESNILYKTFLVYDGIFLTEYNGTGDDGKFKLIWEENCIKVFRLQQYNESPETAQPYMIGVFGESGNVEEIRYGNGANKAFLKHDKHNHLTYKQLKKFLFL